MLSPKGTLGFTFSYVNFTTDVSSGSPVYSYILNYDYILSNKILLMCRWDTVTCNLIIPSLKTLLDYELDNYTISTGLTHKFSDTFKLKFCCWIELSRIQKIKMQFLKRTLQQVNRFWWGLNLYQTQLRARTLIFN